VGTGRALVKAIGSSDLAEGRLATCNPDWDPDKLIHMKMSSRANETVGVTVLQGVTYGNGQRTDEEHQMRAHLATGGTC